MKNQSLLLLCLVAASACFPSVALSQGRQRGRGGRGPDSGFAADRDTFHFLLEHHEQIRRKVTRLNDGVETLTTSENHAIVERLQEHVTAMYKRIEEGRPIRLRDPLFAEVFRHRKKIKMRIDVLDDGIRVTETSQDPYVVKLIQEHADVVSKFVELGFLEARKNHHVPEAAAKSVRKTPEITASERNEVLSLSATFDRAYIPALALTKQEMQRPSEAAISRLRESAPTILGRMKELDGVSSADSAFSSKIQKVIDEANVLIQQRKLVEAHERLEPVRDRMFELRQRLAVDYPVDKLHAFHETMEKIVKPAMSEENTDAVTGFLEASKDLATRASGLWADVEQTSFSADIPPVVTRRIDGTRQAAGGRTQRTLPVQPVPANGRNYRDTRRGAGHQARPMRRWSCSSATFPNPRRCPKDSCSLLRGGRDYRDGRDFAVRYEVLN